MNKNKKIIMKYRKQGIRYGLIIWFFVILLSVVGTILFNWTIIPFSMFGGFILGSYIGHHINNKIMKKTGLTRNEQQEIWKNIFYKTK